MSVEEKALRYYPSKCQECIWRSGQICPFQKCVKENTNRQGSELELDLKKSFHREEKLKGM